MKEQLSSRKNMVALLLVVTSSCIVIHRLVAVPRQALYRSADSVLLSNNIGIRAKTTSCGLWHPVFVDGEEKTWYVCFHYLDQTTVLHIF